MGENKFSADFQRLEALKKFLGISYQEIAAQSGIKSAQSFYAVKSGKQGISRNMASLISARWPEISESWLLSGRGEMQVKEDSAPQVPVGELVTVEKRVLDTIISQQETIRIQAATIQEMARQKGMGTALPEEDAGCAVAG